MGKLSEGTPQAWKAGLLSYGAGLTLETSTKMLASAEKEAEKLGVPMSMAVVDAGGNLIIFRRMDNAILGSIHIAMDKAYTAVLSKLPTNFPEPGSNPPFIHNRWTSFPGGFPIVNEGLILGGIGISGGTIEDLHVAGAALTAGGFSTEDVDAALEGP